MSAQPAERWDPYTGTWKAVPPPPAEAPAVKVGTGAVATRGRAAAPVIRPALSMARTYDGARASRLNLEAPAITSSADAELALGLLGLRNRCRALVRNNAYAKRARWLVESNVIGSGIGTQAQVKFRNGRLREKVNQQIEDAFCEWSAASNCHVAGRLHLSDLQRLLIGEVFEAGEILIRFWDMPFGQSAVPLALEVIEPERLADDSQVPSPARGNVVRLGVEQDRWGRPVAYWLRQLHPGDNRANWAQLDSLERVPADQILHLHLITRWPQSRGEPWMHAAIRKLQDIGGYTEAEIVAARAAASYMGFIKSPEPPTADDTSEDGRQNIELSPGVIEHLAPGEDFVGWNPNRPNSQAEPFIRLMLREVCAATGPSYESISRDYSQGTYSSARQALLEDRDLWRMLQHWFIRSFMTPVYRRFLEAATLFGALPADHLDMLRANPRGYSEVRFKPRGWSWIDPTKEVAAFKEAEKAGYMTKGDIISATAGGADIEDVMKARRRELDLIEQLGLTFDTDQATPGLTAPAAAPAETDETETEPGSDTETPQDNGRVLRLGGPR